MFKRKSDSQQEAEGAEGVPEAGTSGPRRFDITPAPRQAFYDLLVFIRPALLTLGLLAIGLVGYTEWLALQPLPNPTVALPTLDVPRETSSPAPVYITLSPRPTLASQAPDTATPTRTPRPARTGTPVPKATVPAVSASPLPAPSLLVPADGATLPNRVLFRWEWAGAPLKENQAFDLRIWSKQEEEAGATPRGAVAPTKDTQVQVEVAYVPAIQDYGPGDYYWTVVIVELRQQGSPLVIGAWGESRRFVYR